MVPGFSAFHRGGVARRWCACTGSWRRGGRGSWCCRPWSVGTTNHLSTVSASTGRLARTSATPISSPAGTAIRIGGRLPPHESRDTSHPGTPAPTADREARTLTRLHVAPPFCARQQPHRPLPDSAQSSSGEPTPGVPSRHERGAGGRAGGNGSGGPADPQAFEVRRSRLRPPSGLVDRLRVHAHRCRKRRSPAADRLRPRLARQVTRWSAWRAQAWPDRPVRGPSARVPTSGVRVAR